MWKNKHAGASAKKPKRKKKAQFRDWNDFGVNYVTNDKVSYDGRLWTCRKSHQSSETTKPSRGYTFWKEHKSSIFDDTQSREQAVNGDNISDTEN